MQNTGRRVLIKVLYLIIKELYVIIIQLNLIALNDRFILKKNMCFPIHTLKQLKHAQFPQENKTNK